MAKRTSQTLTQLLENTTLNDHEDILKASEIAIKKSPSDQTAWRAKAVALLKLYRYNEALVCFEDAGSSLPKTAPLEYAYSLYKVGRFKDAARLAASLPDGRAARHLEAQSLYRTEAFAEAGDIYDQLGATEFSSESADIGINRRAVETQLLCLGSQSQIKPRKPGRQDLEAFEFAYNAACSSIAQGALRQAEMLLRRAEELCKHSEDLSDDEKTAELLSINVQQVYVLTRLGRREDAETLATRLDLNKISDTATRTIAEHNVHVALPKPSNPFITHRSLSQPPTHAPSSQPLQSQRDLLLWNTRVADLRALKYDGVVRSTFKALKSFPEPSPSFAFTSAGIFNATAQAEMKDGKGVLKDLLAQSEGSPFNLGLLLTIIQIYVSAKNTTSAVNTLEALFRRLETSTFDHRQDLRYNPGLIALAVSLYRNQGRQSRATHELEQAAIYWRQKPGSQADLLQSAGCALVKSLNPSQRSSASEIFDKLWQDDPSDRINSAGYVASYVTTDRKRAEIEINKLHTTSDLTRDINVEGLEKKGIPNVRSSSLAVPSSSPSKKRRATAVDSTAKTGSDPQQPPNAKRKRIRKSRLPKHYDPNKTPDPERWLPLRDRSSYRPPKGKKGKRREGNARGGGGGGTQGGVVAMEIGEKVGVATVSGGPGGRGNVGNGGGGKNTRKKR